ncbi:MAG: hypothetical protein ACM3WV_00940 [Bacillota bacterium]
MTDLEILTRIVWGEAEAEIVTEKVGVAASIINQSRAENKSFHPYLCLEFLKAPWHLPPDSNAGVSGNPRLNQPAFHYLPPLSVP